MLAKGLIILFWQQYCCR